MIEAKYDDIGRFSEGLAWFILDEKVGFLDKTGKVVIPPTYALDDEHQSMPVGNFNSGLAWFRKGSGEDAREGYIDKTGKVVIEAKFLVAFDFEHGLAEVFTTDNKQAYINTKGEFIWKAP